MSLMQPAAAEGPGRPALAPESLAAVAEADVEPSDVFFHKYFALAAQKGAKAGRAAGKARAEGEESTDSEADIGVLSGLVIARPWQGLCACEPVFGFRMHFGGLHLGSMFRVRVRVSRADASHSRSAVCTPVTSHTNKGIKEATPCRCPLDSAGMAPRPDALRVRR